MIRIDDMAYCSEWLKVVFIIAVGLIALPIVVLLYCIPTVRLAFNQLAYEDAMRG